MDGDDEVLQSFCADEQPAIEELLAVVGGEARKHLDFSPESLTLLDAWVLNITSESDWAASDIWQVFGIHDRLPRWIELGCAYYFAAVLRKRFGGEWTMYEDPQKEGFVRPFFGIGDTLVDALRVGHEIVAGELPEGLAGFSSEVTRRLHMKGSGGSIA